jgi:hypothetical protein
MTPGERMLVIAILVTLLLATALAVIAMIFPDVLPRYAEP